MARCLVALGSNLGDKREHLDRAVELLGFMPGVSMLGVSRYRETKPIGGPPGQPPFLNAACLVETDIGPLEFLGLLQAVEGALERERTVRWGPRTVDLDLLIHGETVLESERLVLPHPRMATRRFVLEPSAEIAPDLRHPTAGCSVGELLANISRPDPYVAVTGVPGTPTAEVAAAVADRLLARLVRPPAPHAVDPSALGEAVAAWSRSLSGESSGEDRSGEVLQHGVVSDGWFGTFWLDPSGPPAVEAAAAARVACPQVVIVLLADERRLPQPLVRMQSRMVDLLRGRGIAGLTSPKAVVPIRAEPLETAVGEAVAAVEAMG